jgi:hypothetical protein
MVQRIPDEALVVRGGQNLPENFANASGATVGADGMLDGVSVNSGAGMPVEDLTAPNSATGYPGIPNKQIGVTTVGAIRAPAAGMSYPLRQKPIRTMRH